MQQDNKREIKLPNVQLKTQENIFFYIAILTTFFLCLEISYFIQSNRAYFADFVLISKHLALPVAILPGVLFFIAMQLLVHIAFCCYIWLLTVGVGNFFHLNESQKIYLSILIWLLGLFTIIVANQCLFPNSKFAELSHLILTNKKVTSALFMGLLVSLISISVIASVCVFKFILKSKKIILILTCLLGLFLLQYSTPPSVISKQPNIFIIGVDSLRPDFLSYFGSDKNTPFIDNFLAQSTIFTEAVTPLARTFPAWTSILTGNYPIKTGVRFDLTAQTHLNLGQTLATQLKQQGYKTIYATDETRFSNIDKNYGFAHLITPPIGLNDFLIGTFNDFPLSNLLVNTIAGKYLFPYSYGNRPVYFTYEPQSFLNLVSSHLNNPHHKPIFLAIHFCLTHYPYLWAHFPAAHLSMAERYQASVQRFDQQLHDFFQILKAKRLLDHAIVVLLSDHGEALELNGDRITAADMFLSSHHQPVPNFYPPSLDAETIEQAAGHGGDVLSLSQYHTVLAFKLYGQQQRPQEINGTVSLLAIKPTILDLLHSTSSKNSLAKFILGKSKTLAPEHIFLESDFTPAAVRTVHPETRKVLLEDIHMFEINPHTTRLSVRPEMAEMIIDSKQYADLYGDWILALYPQNNIYRMPILINLRSGQWTNDLHSAFAMNSPAQSMLQHLQQFFGNEINKLCT